ncbi:hypothetical protein HRI96_05825 [Treponema parvum]|uniref:Tetratricopeptide repeat protein n=1 Tax=Treponema parvum TaxID=138851 RepID=A0A975ICC1_9SPIR|nr:hypothetical protein [Treponema parvum]QTQ11760.1 hypothetical protein HRI96_05825 [Treponema parvum]QTQ16294.1 hypothetical protein HXT04_06100 [Treponema parvum]
MKNAKILWFVFFSLSVCFVYSQNLKKPEKKDYLLLMEAQSKYDALDYGGALKDAVEAKKIRKELSDWRVFTLKKALSPAAVRKAGDLISDVLPVLESRNEKNAVDIINFLVEIKSLNFFNNSVNRLIEYVSESKAYPEADYLCGRIYQIEGEYKIAMQFYDTAVKNASFLDIYSVKYDILYNMADIAFQQGNTDEYETYLLSILADDNEHYKNKTFKTAVLRTIGLKTEKEPLKKFFELYRAESRYFYRAYYLLSEFYDKNGDSENALFISALGSLSVFTRLYEIIKQRDPQYTYAGLADLFSRMPLWDDVDVWAKDNNIWDMFFNFIQLAKKRGGDLFAVQFLNVIKESAPEKYWRDRAATLLAE